MSRLWCWHHILRFLDLLFFAAGFRLGVGSVRGRGRGRLPLGAPGLLGVLRGPSVRGMRGSGDGGRPLPRGVNGRGLGGRGRGRLPRGVDGRGNGVRGLTGLLGSAPGGFGRFFGA